MIAIAGTIHFVDPADRDACVAAAVEWVRSTRQDEPGCLGYSFSADPVDADRIAVFELWADEESLARHFGHPNFAAMRHLLRGYPRHPSAVRKYRIDLDGPVYDESGTPRADFVGSES